MQSTTIIEEVYGIEFTAVAHDLPEGISIVEIYLAESYHNVADELVYLNLPYHVYNVMTRIYNRSGKLVLPDQVDNRRLRVGHFNPGIYFIQVFDISNEINYQQ